MNLTLEQRIELMDKFTRKYKRNKGLVNKYELEVLCLKEIFPNVFTGIQQNDYLLGRCIALPVGFSMEWAHLGGGELDLTRDEQTLVNGSSSPEVNSSGPSFYGIIPQLVKMKEFVDRPHQIILNKLIEYWGIEDTHLEFVKKFESIHHKSTYTSDIHDFKPPLLLLTRLSGMQLDYNKILTLGITKLKGLIDKTTEFGKASVEALNILLDVIDYYKEYVDTLEESELKTDLLNNLDIIKNDKPHNFYSAMQLTYLYSQLAGVVNYGRMDEYLGDLLVNDLNNKTLSYDKALNITANMWELIDKSCNRGNGRVIVGGEGRSNSKNADVFAKLAIEATIKTHLPKPQLTLRISKDQNEDVYNTALEAIKQGCTFPMLYIDDVNINGISKAMNIPVSDAVDYTPYGCGEYMIHRKSIGTPNACINFVKAMTLCFNNGTDNFDNVYRGGKYSFKDIDSFNDYESFRDEYFSYAKYLLEVSTDFQKKSYEHMNEKGGFIFSSLLTDDCISRSKGLLDGGVRYESGVLEFYGFTNTIDSLAAVKKLVFDDKKYSLRQLIDAINNNYENKDIIKDIENCPKYGNDLDYVDNLGIEFHNFVCNCIRDYGKEVGMYSYLGVNINNNANTRWGLKTGATFDGRVKEEHLSPGNNPHSGRDKNGITAMLNSISKFDSTIHAGYVQNLKLSPKLMNEKIEIVKVLFDEYFKRGGTQLMVNVVDQKDLLQAQITPEKYQNLIVRCGGFSARFIELDINTQTEIINRTCNE